MERVMSTMHKITLLRSRLDREKGARESVEKRLKACQDDLYIAGRAIVWAEKAQKLAQACAEKTQRQLEYRLTELVTLALQAVYGTDAPEFGLNFVQRRGRTEVDMVLRDADGHELDPMTAGGGGVVDLVAFGLRLSLMTLDKSAGRIVFLDEPFRCPSRELRPRIGKLLRELHERLGYQFIIITHADELVEHADKVFRIEQKNGISQTAEVAV